MSDQEWGYEPETDGPPIKNGRYQLPGLDGQSRAYTRVTTFARTVSDNYALEHWEKRVLAHGLGLRPDLVRIAAVTDVADKQAMKAVVEQGLEAGGRTSSANEGTALHTVLRRLITGDLQWDQVPDEMKADTAAVFSELQRYGLRQIPELCERTVINDDYETAGTFDTALVDSDNVLVLADFKSGQRLDLSAAEFAIQFSQYARSRRMWDPTTKTVVPAPQFRQDYALVIHVPRGSGQCFVHRVNLVMGYALSRLAYEVRAARNMRELITPHIAPTGIEPGVAVPMPAGTAQLSGQQISGPASVQQVAQALSGLAVVPDPPAQVPIGAPLVTPSTYDQGGSLPSFDPAAVVAQMANGHAAGTAPMPAAQGPQETPPLSSPVETGGDADELVTLTKQVGGSAKARMQSIAKLVDPALKLERTTANLAADIVSSERWPERRASVLDGLRQAVAEKPGRGRPRKAEPETAPEPAAPIAPVPTAAEAAQALGVEAPASNPNAKYVITGQTDVTAENLSSLSPQAAAQVQRAQNVQNGVMPDGSGPIPGHEPAVFGTPEPEDDHDPIADAPSTIELFQAYQTAGQQVDHVAFYRRWLELSANMNDLRQILNHCQQTQTVLPPELVEFGNNRSAKFRAES
jgi:hypothetical protein